MRTTAAHQGYEAIVFLMSISILSVSCRKVSDPAAIIRGTEEETSNLCHALISLGGCR